MVQERISYDSKSFIINEKRRFIFSGELHYFRIPPTQWKDRLLKCRRAFLNTLGAYIAWNRHEEKEGEFDFSADRDLNRWLSLAEEVGLYVFIRPGPYICSEWDFGGFSNWLIAKDCELRSLEPNYIRYCARYLDKVNEVIKPHLITKGGKVILYQIENEFEVGDIPYHRKLKELVEEDGIDIPICTNENPWIRGTEIIEGPDPYLRSWVIAEPMYQIKDLIKTQPDKPPFAPEVGTHMYIRQGGLLPFSDGYRPSELDEVYLKSLIASGISGFNWYMYGGGTNLGYWTARDVATTYDFEAPIREWGELGERYYISRRLGGFLESFGEILLETVPVEEYCKIEEKGVEIFTRKDKEKAFLFLSNIYAKGRKFKFSVSHPLTGEDITIPKKGLYELPGYSMTIVPINLRLSDSYTLLYSTSEIFYFVDNGKEKVLILYRDSGIDGETALKVKGNVKVTGIEDYHLENSTLYLNYTHKDSPQIINIDGEEILKLIIVNKEIASKTWFFNYQGQKYPILSNIYFLEEEKEEGNISSLTFQVREGSNWLQIPLQPKEVKLDGRTMDFQYNREKNITLFALPKEKMPEINYPLKDKWKRIEDNKEAEVTYDDSSWLDWEPWDPLEKYGFLKNGYTWYRTHFNLQKFTSPLYLTLTGFQDEASIYINGKYLTSGRDNLRCEMSSLVKEGDNVLAILIESLGHHCGGEKSPNGINCPIYISSGEKTLQLKEWKRKLLSETYPEQSLLKGIYSEISPAFDDSGWEKVKIDWNWDSRLIKHPREECFVWYRTEAILPPDFKGKYLSLDFPQGLRDKVYLYINGKFIGLRENTFLGTPFSFDITDAVAEGKNTIVVGIKADRWVTYFGLQGIVRITTHDIRLDKNWRIKEGLSGESTGYPSLAFDDSIWEEVEIPENKSNSPGSLIWYRKKINIDIPSEYIAPLRLTLKNTNVKALIYFNGILIGRYSENGPQEDFYIYEDFIKKENVIAILVDGRNKGARLGEISISPYYIAKRINVSFQW